jgi:hypothetical protein
MHATLAMSDVPPALKKGRGIPITGKSPTAMPMLTIVWKVTSDPNPIAMMLENAVRDMEAMLKARNATVANKEITITPPMNPNSSVGTQKMKSVHCSGM